jgi:transcriptional regulator GlxA family with amidase domain
MFQLRHRCHVPSAPLRLLLIDDFALMSFASAVEPLRAANILAGRTLYDWFHISTGASTIAASNGLSVTADHTIADKMRFDTVLVCAGGNPASFDDAKTIAWLRRIARSGCEIGGVSGGPFILAKAGILYGVRCTIHWEHLAASPRRFRIWCRHERCSRSIAAGSPAAAASPL